MSKYQLKSRIWITTKSGTYLGEGRIRLLKQIKEHGSISKAAKEMKMSYKKAWELVNSMNNESSSDLVKRKTGGIGGGGAIVSKKGLEAIKLFEELTEECGAFFNEKMKTINL
mgnify:CR=1 FL=1|jgi:molybdate transport system regulatory protein